MNEPKIKPQFKQFAINYAGEANGNAIEAARLAGYSEKYAKKFGHKILVRADVQSYLEYIREVGIPKEENQIATVAQIQKFWSDVMNDTSNELRDRLRAAELLAKVKGAFNRNEW